MKKGVNFVSNHPKKILAVLLSLAMLFTVALPAVSAVTAKNGTGLQLIDYDASELNVKKLGETAEGSPAVKYEYADDEIVRVSIILGKKATLDAGFESKGIALNKAATAYRADLKAEQAKVTAKVEAALGEKLQVKPNLTLAINAISAKVYSAERSY